MATRHAGRIGSHQLDEIAAAAEKILAADPDPGMVAAPSLHVQSAHPNALRRFEPLFDAAARRGKILRALLVSAGMPARAIFKASDWWSGDPLPERADVLFVSHFLNRSQAGKTVDPYFGDLAGQLTDRGYSVVTALIDHSSNGFSGPETNDWATGRSPRVLLARSIGFKDEFRIGMELGSAAMRIARLRADPDLAKLAGLAAIDCLDTGSRDALRIGKHVGRLAGRLRPKLLVVTYEGQSWERVAFQAARAAAGTVHCAGYSHAAMFPFQCALAVRLSNGYDPDTILTAGDLMRERLEERASLQNVEIATLGSVRATPPVEGSQAGKEPVCLILPEGILSEAVELLSFSARAASANPAVQFRIRLHPAMSKDGLLGTCPQFRSFPENMSWGREATLNEELRSASWMLYRGTTSAIQAIMYGVRPLYLELPGEAFDIDPLAQLGTWRKRVSQVEDLTAVLSLAPETPDKTSPAELVEAREFCMRYFMPMRSEVIVDLIERAGKAE
ncbi:MAG: hypothetical protein KDK08_06785 [Rhizobiaceae bacterium]|nr:hypothetical protein [Rhizobiaceae bacterium]